MQSIHTAAIECAVTCLVQFIATTQQEEQIERSYYRFVTMSLLKLLSQKLYLRYGGGGVLPPKSYVDVPAGRQKSDFLYSNFMPNFPPISIPLSKEKHLILTKLSAFYNNLPKLHPNFVIWAPSVSNENPPIAIPNFAKKHPKRQVHIRIPCQCKNPPPPRLRYIYQNRLLQFFT